MHVTSQTDHDALPPVHSLGNECFTTVLLVEAETTVAQAVQTSLGGALDDSLRFECVAGLAEARARHLTRNSSSGMVEWMWRNNASPEDAAIAFGLGQRALLHEPQKQSGFDEVRTPITARYGVMSPITSPYGSA